MDVTVKIDRCLDCRHLDHSGAFTPGGAKNICGHGKASRYFITKHQENRYHWEHRVVDAKKPPPENCPLRHGHQY